MPEHRQLQAMTKRAIAKRIALAIALLAVVFATIPSTAPTWQWFTAIILALIVCLVP